MSATVTDFVTNNLRTLMMTKNVSEEFSERVISDVPVQIKRALITLQRLSVLPVKSWENFYRDVREIHYGKDREKVYEFIKLPADFGELDRFYTTPEIGQYKFYDDEYELLRRESSDLGFTIVTHEHFEDDLGTEMRLVLDPPLEESRIVTIRYHVTASRFDFEKLDERFWEPIYEQVLIQLNFRSSMDTGGVMDGIHRLRHPHGSSNNNGSVGKVRPSYFGRKFPK